MRSGALLACLVVTVLAAGCGGSEGATPELVSLRVKGPDAIAIYTAEGDFYFMPFDRDQGEWRVSELNGEALVEGS